MAIPVSCKCGRRFHVPEKHAGKTTKCPGCGGPLRIEAANVAAETSVEFPKSPASPGVPSPASDALTGWEMPSESDETSMGHSVLRDITGAGEPDAGEETRRAARVCLWAEYLGMIATATSGAYAGSGLFGNPLFWPLLVVAAPAGLAALALAIVGNQQVRQRKAALERKAQTDATVPFLREKLKKMGREALTGLFGGLIGLTLSAFGWALLKLGPR